MSNTSLNLVNLDFASFKSQLKTYLKSQELFKDYDFDGSNMSVLLDVLSYNTYTNAFYLNMIGNEMFMDSAVLKDSVVSHAKMLNYLPRSFKSAKAVIDIAVNGGPITTTAITMPKGTSFSSRVGSNNYTFVTNQNITLSGLNGTFTGNNISIYEGQYYSDSFVINSANTSQKFILSNQAIDTDSLTITSIEDNGANIIPYMVATSLLDKTGNSQIYFLQAAQNERYEVLFGDGITGRKPKDNSVIVCEYRVTNGELPNGAFKFINDGSISTLSNVAVSTVTAAFGGAISETIESIKINAPRYFTAQERAITTEDYENLLKINYPEVLAVSAYGGEEVDPPQYGRVFVAVDIDQVDGLPTSKKDQYYDFLKTRCPVSIEPIIVEPDMTYVYVHTLVRYNINTTALLENDISLLVLSAISSFSTTYLNDFKKTLRYSQLVRAIDDANSNIVDNETDIEAVKKIYPSLNTTQSINVDFKMALEKNVGSGVARHNGLSTTTVFSTNFTYKNQLSRFQDDGTGKLNIVAVSDSSSIANIGTVDYDTGKITITNLNISSYEGTSLKIYVRTLTKDISTLKNAILQIATEDVEITVDRVRV